MKESRHSRYLGEYKMAADGQYIYTGSSFALENTNGEMKKLCVLWICSLLTVIGSGFINAAGLNNSFYVILPYIGEVACLFALSWQIIRLLWNKGELKEYYYNKFVNSIPAASAFMSVFSGAGFIGSVVFIILHGFEGKPVLCVLYLILKLTVLALGALTYRFFKTINWEKKEHSN